MFMAVFFLPYVIWNISEFRQNGGILILYDNCREMFLPDAQPFPKGQHLSHF